MRTQRNRSMLTSLPAIVTMMVPSLAQRATGLFAFATCPPPPPGRAS